MIGRGGHRLVMTGGQALMVSRLGRTLRARFTPELGPPRLREQQEGEH